MKAIRRPSFVDHSCVQRVHPQAQQDEAIPRTRETLQAQFDERFNWTDYAQLQRETQALQIDVNVLRHACEKYKQDNVFLASLFLTLAAATVAVGRGLACLVAAPVAVTVILG